MHGLMQSKGWMLFLVVTVALGLAGGGYAAWTTSLHVEGTVQTGSVDAVWDMQEDNKWVGVLDPATGQVVQRPVPEGKDIAECVSSLQEGQTARTVGFRVVNAYPSFTCEIIMGGIVTGSVPVHISRVQRMATDAAGSNVLGTELNVDVRLTRKVQVDDNTFTCDDRQPLQVSSQLHQGDRFCAIIRIHANQIARQGHVYQGGVWIDLIQWNLAGIVEVPSFTVVNPGGLTLSQFQALREQFGLPSESFVPVGDGGFIHHTNLARFAFVPTVMLSDDGDPGEEDQSTVEEALDRQALQRLQVMDTKVAMEGVMSALENARAMPGGLYEVIPQADHTTLSFFDVFAEIGEQSFNIDTQVSLNTRLEGLPVVGPGARINLGFSGVLGDEAFTLSNMDYALPAVQKGQMVPIVPMETAQQQVRSLVLTDLASSGFNTQDIMLSSMTAQLVYYVPPPEQFAASMILPYWQIDSTFDAGGGQSVLARSMFVPATNGGLAPQVTLEVDVDGARVSAQASVTGGMPPYTYMWSSSSTVLEDTNQASISYEVDLKSLKELPGTEVVGLVVADANGTMVNASQAFQVGSGLVLEDLVSTGRVAGLASPSHVGGVKDVGTEWVGNSQGLPGSGANATGFVNRMKTDPGTVARFNWGDFNAWERDFKDQSIAASGDDHDWVDNVDALFYTGHANADGWTFPGTNDDGFLHYTEARYGNNNDLEWLFIAACGPLQSGTSPNRWYQRWGPAFQRLHLLAGYQNVSNDNTVEGDKLARYMLQGYTVRQAWIRMAKDVQPSSVRWAVMGAIRDDGVTNWNDHWHGRGSVGPDIPPSRISGFWMLSGSS